MERDAAFTLSRVVDMDVGTHMLGAYCIFLSQKPEPLLGEVTRLWSTRFPLGLL